MAPARGATTTVPAERADTRRTADSSSSRLVRRRPAPADVAAALGFLAIATSVLWHQWRSLGTGYLVRSANDQTMWEWFFTVAAHAVAGLDNPLSTDLQNYPDGVNLMGNTAMLGVSVPLAPVTLVFGATVTFTLALTLGLAGTAFAWYFLFSRHVVSSRVAAAVGGLVCGFAPAMISHTNGHPNFVALFVLPLLIVALLRVATGRRPVRDGVVLGLLGAYQVFLGEEPLLIFAVALTVFGIVYAASRPRAALAAARRSVRGLAVAAPVAAVVVAVPLWWQFFGPDSYDALEHGPQGSELGALTNFPTSSLAGGSADTNALRMNPTEENAFFGWPLLIVFAAASLWLVRSTLARAASATALAMMVLSLGHELTIGGRDTGIALPWARMAEWPLLESVFESRFAMGAIPAIALVLALATERALRWRRAAGSVVPALWTVGVVGALLPLVPTPLPVADRAPAPAFFANGTWREYVDDGAVVTVPLPSPDDATALRWQTEQHLGFRLAGGYFVGPGRDGAGKYGPVDRPTALLLADVARTGKVPQLDADARARARADLAFWHADVLVLPPSLHSDGLRQTVTDLVGAAPSYVDDVWVWDTHDLCWTYDGRLCGL
ncbi:glycosyl transferase [Rhodococcus sp. HNM0569]|nr:glycosyl transferase [Rhodococcus sp. HNM0569]